MRGRKSLMILTGGLLVSLGPAIASGSAERIFLAVVLLVPAWAYVAILTWPGPADRPRPAPMKSAQPTPARAEGPEPSIAFPRAGAPALRANL